MSARQTIDRSWQPAANWLAQWSAIAANAEIIGRHTGLTLADILRRWSDPRPNIGDPVAEFRHDGVRLINVASVQRTTAVDEAAERLSYARYCEARDRLAGKFGVEV